jgi:hypothetical protein
MVRRIVVIVAWATVLGAGVAAQDRPSAVATERPSPPAAKADEPPIVTHHEVRVGNRTL